MWKVGGSQKPLHESVYVSFDKMTTIMTSIYTADGLLVLVGGAHLNRCIEKKYSSRFREMHPRSTEDVKLMFGKWNSRAFQGFFFKLDAERLAYCPREA